MGLDAVDIVMRVEKTFAIEIKDAEAEGLTTVGKLHDLVWNKIDGKVSESCISQSIFYKLRSGIIDIYGVDRADIAPSTMLPALIPNKQRSEYWHNFSQITALKLPELVYRQPYHNIDYLLRLNIFVCCLFPILFSWHYGVWWPLLFLPVSYILLRGFSKAFADKKTAAPPIDVRQFVQQVLSLNFQNIRNATGELIHINRLEMEHIINNVIVDVLGVDIDEVRPEKSFVKDLGV